MGERERDYEIYTGYPVTGGKSELRMILHKKLSRKCRIYSLN